MPGENVSFGNVHGPVQTGDGVQYTSGRDQYISGRDQVVVRQSGSASIGSAADVAVAVDQLRTELARMRLTAAERQTAERDLTGLETALTAPDDQRDAAAQHLHSFATGLKEAGAMASASTSVVESVGKIASWLGPLGASILALL